jgi:hypothetical protein
LKTPSSLIKEFKAKIQNNIEINRMPFQKHLARLLLNIQSPNNLTGGNEMDVLYAGPIANIIESVGFLMTFSLVTCFIVIAGCLCLKMYERVFPKQNSERRKWATHL